MDSSGCHADKEIKKNHCHSLKTSPSQSDESSSVSAETNDEEAGSINFNDNKNEKVVFFENYLLSGPMALFIGMGSGHAIQGRYHERGWIFSLGFALSAMTMVGGFVAFLMTAPPCEGDDCSNNTSLPVPAKISLGVTMVGATAFALVKVWETMDVFILPEGYRIVKNNPIAIQPFYSSYLGKESLGVSLKWQF